jgi:hypothetical protein
LTRANTEAVLKLTWVVSASSSAFL